jgi:hypothetical protein
MVGARLEINGFDKIPAYQSKTLCEAAGQAIKGSYVGVKYMCLEVQPS